MSATEKPAASGETGSGVTGFGEISPGETGSGVTGFGEISPGETGSGEISPDETRPGATASAATASGPAPVGLGRELAPAVVLLSGVVGGISAVVGALLVGTSLLGHAAGAWVSTEALTPGLVGAAMAGVAPALFTIGRARHWAEARTLVLPLVIVLVGLFTVSLLNAGSLQAVRGGPLFLALFSLGWVATLGLLALGAVVCLGAQYRRPAAPHKAGSPRPAPVPLPAWSKPLLAVLGSGWLGIGAGLLVLPAFWGPLLPWTVNRADAQGLGVWALALGVGVLGSLAEDDLSRIRPALTAVPAVASASAVVLAVHAGSVDWTSGPGAALLALVGGLFVTGVSGRWLLRRAEGGSARPAP
ncbi:hypothetical protein [Streptomyces sp. NPDC056144]|uniref:hypothetical protein n=1 Tax=unclassified Streptomyces TaxID=2593676 RepID=UPI0035D9D511